MSECAHPARPMAVRRRRRRRGARRDSQLLKPMRFVSLHHHSTFSYLDGFQMPEVHARRIAEINGTAIAMTEHGNISSHARLERACMGEKDPVSQEKSQAEGIKPIYGCEFYTGKVGENATQRKYHLTVLAENEVGYRNLLRLVSLSFSEGFHYEPTVSWDMLKRHKEGLFILSGCQGSALFCAAVGGKLVPDDKASYRRALKVARAFAREFGDHYYIEVQAFPQLEKTRKFNPMAERLARAVGARVVATKDCHYTVPEEAEVQKILHNVRPGEKRTLEDQVRNWGYDVPLCPPTTDRSIYHDLLATGLSKQAATQSIISTEEIAQQCTVVLPKLPMLRYPLPQGYDDEITLWRDWLRDGWKYRGCPSWPQAERRRARAMLAKEMGVIEGKDFVSYFLVVSDAVRYAKDHGIPVGPGRGSAAASLVCWLLRITEVNPLLFPNLVFERFIDESRQDLPDIDLDFDSDRRHEVREYLVAKYGEGRVSNIGTFSYYKSKLSLDDVGKVHKVPPYEVAKVKELLIERSSGDLRASATIEDTVEQFDVARDVVERYPELRKAMELEGNIKQFGVHSAGLVVSNGPITDVCAVYTREVPKGSGRILEVVSLDKHDAERQGLLKLDFLGLATMAMIAEALRQLNMPLESLYDIPLNDPKVIDGFRRGDVVGIFQFEGRAQRSVNGSLKPDSFKELCDIGALARPGPLHNGAANKYIEIKRGMATPDRLHPALDAITADTNYEIVYQEQILRIVREIGDFEWTHAAYIRKIISKKLGEQEFNRQIRDYLAGAANIHKRTKYPPMSEEIARKIWGMCITAGSYAFNAAHSISYAMIGYWAQWLKQYHPAVFYAASLSKTPKESGSGSAGERHGALSGVGTDRHQTLMRDAVRGNGPRPPVKIRGPHPARSNAQWQATGKKYIRAGFAQVNGVGPSIADKIMDYRQDNPVKTWDDLLPIKGIGAKTLDRFKELDGKDDPFDIHKLDRVLAGIKDQLDEWGLPAPSHNSAEVPYEGGEDVEVVWLGMPIHRNLRDLFESNRARTGEELDPSTVKRPDLNEFLMMAGYDGEDILSLRFNRWKYPRFKRAIWKTRLGHDLVLIRGVKPGWRTAREVYVKQMWVIDPE